MPDAQIHPIGDEAAPADYIIPPGAELLLKGVYAKFNGAGAGSPYLPLVRIISDADSTVIEAVADTTIAAGASADASWFPHLASKPSSASGGIQFDVDNVGGSLEVETTDYVPVPFSQPASVTFGDDATGYGTAINASKGTLFTAAPDLNSGLNADHAVVKIEAGATSNFHTQLGLRVIADTSSVSTAGAIGASFNINGADFDSGGVGVGVSTTSGVAIGYDARVDTTGGEALGVRGVTTVSGGSANSVAVQGRARVIGGGTGLAVAIEALNAFSGNPIFQVRDDGSVHIPTGTSIIADL